jgi:hypothetical protein
MPIIRNISMNLEIEEVLRRQGFREYHKIKPEIKRLILELISGVKSTHLLEPAAAYEIYPVTRNRGERLSVEGDLMWHAPSFFMAKARELAVIVGTIGPRLEKQVTDYFNQGDPLRGILLDGIGSAAVSSLTQEVCKLIAGGALSRGYQTSSYISPGMPGLPITEQPQLLKMVPTREIGVSMTSSGMMVPCKSVSMVIGIGPQMKSRTRVEICAGCNLRKTCAYKCENLKNRINKVQKETTPLLMS